MLSLPVECFPLTTDSWSMIENITSAENTIMGSELMMFQYTIPASGLKFNIKDLNDKKNSALKFWISLKPNGSAIPWNNYHHQNLTVAGINYFIKNPLNNDDDIKAYRNWNLLPNTYWFNILNCENSTRKWQFVVET